MNSRSSSEWEWAFSAGWNTSLYHGLMSECETKGHCITLFCKVHTLWYVHNLAFGTLW